MYRWFFILFLLAVMVGAAYYYYNSTQSIIGILTSNNATLKSDVDKLLKANSDNVRAIEEQAALQKEVADKFSEIQDEFQIIRSQTLIIDDKIDHDLDAIAVRKTEILENLLNKGSDNALRCFEIISGSPLSPNEKMENYKNPECVWLFK